MKRTLEILFVLSGLFFVSGPIYLFHYFVVFPVLGTPKPKFIPVRGALTAVKKFILELA